MKGLGMCNLNSNKGLSVEIWTLAEISWLLAEVLSFQLVHSLPPST